MVSSQKTKSVIQVVGQHQPQHRRHEEHEVEIEAVQVGMAAQIAAGIERDNGPDAADQQRKGQA